MKKMPLSRLSAINFLLDTLHLTINDVGHIMSYSVEMVRRKKRIPWLVSMFLKIDEVRGIGRMIKRKCAVAKAKDKVTFQIMGNFCIDIINNFDDILLGLLAGNWSLPQRCILVLFWHMMSWYCESTVMLRARQVVKDRDHPDYIAYEKKANDVYVRGIKICPALFVSSISCLLPPLSLHQFLVPLEHCVLPLSN